MQRSHRVQHDGSGQPLIVYPHVPDRARTVVNEVQEERNLWVFIFLKGHGPLIARSFGYRIMDQIFETDISPDRRRRERFQVLPGETFTVRARP